MGSTSTHCLGELDAELRHRLVDSAGFYRREGRPPVTLSQLRLEAASGEYGHDLALDVLLLPEPTEGIPFLKELLAVDNAYVAFDAAVVLALLGDRAGVPLLKAPMRYPMSSSNHAFAHGKAALLLLGESIPSELRDLHSVFRDIEDLIGRCMEQADRERSSAGP